MNSMDPKHRLEVQFSGGMVTQTHHTPPVFLTFPDPGMEFGCFMGTALLSHLADHAFQACLLGPLLLDNVSDGITPVLSSFSTLVLVYDFPDGVTENLPAGFNDAQ